MGLRVFYCPALHPRQDDAYLPALVLRDSYHFEDILVVQTTLSNNLTSNRLSPHSGYRNAKSATKWTTNRSRVCLDQVEPPCNYNDRVIAALERAFEYLSLPAFSLRTTEPVWVRIKASRVNPQTLRQVIKLVADVLL